MLKEFYYNGDRGVSVERIETIEKLLKKRKYKDILRELNDVDIAEAFEQLPNENMICIFRLLLKDAVFHI